MSNYTDQTTSSPILNFYSSASQLTSQPNPSGTQLHMIPAGGVSLPSDRYINFTLPASQGTYTALADGWILVGKFSSSTNQILQIKVYNSTSTVYKYDVKTFCPTTSQYVAITAPVSKGDVALFNYTVAGTTDVCRFIYANGSPNVSA